MYNYLPADKFISRFYHEWKASPESDRYNLPFIFKFDRNLKEKKLLDSLNSVFSQWFPEVGAHVVEIDQTINLAVPKSFEAVFESIEFNSTSEAEAKIRQFTSLPFDVNNQPMHRFLLLSGENECYFLMVFHHIIFDESCVPTMIDSLSDYYNNTFINSDVINQPRLSDYLQSHDESSEQELKDAKGFWQKALNGKTLSVNLDFPTLSSSKKIEELGRFSKIHFSLSEEEHRAWYNRCRKLRTTEFFSAKAILSIVVNRYTGCDDFVVAYPTSSRPKTFSSVPGCFVNVLPSNIELSERTSVDELIRDLTLQRKSAKKYSDYPIPNIIRDHRLKHKGYDLSAPLNVEISQSCLQHAMFEFGGAKCTGGFYGGESFSNLCSLEATSDISLAMDTRGTGAQFSLHYNTKTVSSVSESLVESFLSILREWILDDQISCDDVNLNSREKYEQLISVGTSNAFPLPYEDINKRFDDIVRLSPNAIAVVDKGEETTYADLDRLAQSICREIDEHIGTGDSFPSCIALAFPRGKLLVAAMIAVWKAGHAFVPLDPNNPATFNDTIISLSSAAMVLGSKGQLDELADTTTKLEIGDFPQESNTSPFIQQVTRSKNSLAYIVFTSGSTGTPKGVMVEDKGLINLSDYYKESLHVGKKDRSSQFASQCFDTFGCEVWPFILNGGSVAVVPKEVRLSPPDLDKWLREHQVTICDLPSSIAHQFLSVDLNKSQLRIVKFGGEKLQNIPKIEYPFEIINSYGPTEATIETTFSILYSPNDKSEMKPSSTIGRPISRMNTFILDSNYQPVPLGVKGEVYISGVGLMRGYLNDPEKTKQSLFPISLANHREELVYKTGDIARWRENEEIEYISRNDNQIQLRGYRIEIQAIESMLCLSDMISNAAVVVEGSGDKAVLVGYVTVNDLEVFNKTELYNVLLRTYPSYWLPSSLNVVSALPLNSRGKVDKNKLQDLAITPIEIKSENSQPFTILERDLANIWADLLEVSSSNLSIDSHFYYEGGSSLSLVELMIAIEKRFGVTLSLMDLAKATSIKDQAKLLTRNKEIGVADWECFQTVEGTTPLVLLPPRGAGMESYEEFAARFGNISVYGVESHNLYANLDSMIYSIKELASHNIHVLKQKLPNGPYKLAGWSMGGNVAQEMARQLEEQGDTVSAVFMFDSIVLDQRGVKLSEAVDVILERILVESEKYQSLTFEAQNKLFKVKEIENSMYINHRHQACSAPCWLFKARDYAYPTSYTTDEKIIIDDFYSPLREDDFNGWRNIITNLNIIPVNATHKNILQCDDSAKIIELCEEEVCL